MSDPTKYYTSSTVPTQEQKLSLHSSATANSLATSISGSAAYPFQTAASSLCEPSNSVYMSDISRGRNNENVVPSVPYGTSDVERAVVGSRATVTTNTIYGDPTRRPLLSPQNSILALKPTIWPNNENTMMQVSFFGHSYSIVDEQIYVPHIVFEFKSLTTVLILLVLIFLFSLIMLQLHMEIWTGNVILNKY